MNESITFCNECHHEFFPDLQTEGVTHQINYFDCPSCGYRYTSFVTDPQVRRWMKEVRDIHQEKQVAARKYMDKKITEGQYKREIDNINKKQGKIKKKAKKRMDELKKRLSV